MKNSPSARTSTYPVTPAPIDAPFFNLRPVSRRQGLGADRLEERVASSRRERWSGYTETARFDASFGVGTNSA